MDGPGEEFAGLVRRHRLAARLTQEQVAERAGLHVRSLRSVESGRVRSPRRQTARAIGAALGLAGDRLADFVAAARHEYWLERADAGPTGAGGTGPGPVEAGPTDAGPAPGPAADARPARPAEQQRPVPRQLPADVAGFVGRARELAGLDTLTRSGPQRAGAVVVSAVSGAGGVGKTALALRWAHDRADRFPDGQLYANLRGFGPGVTPLRPEEALRGFLDALGVLPERIPNTVDAQAALYRSLLAGRRALVVLDNARDAEQVRPLLPGGATGLVLVTSRNRLTGLIANEGARPLPLDLLSDAEAHDLLANRIGRVRLDAEPGAAAEIVRRCANLPLALVVVAARAALAPALPLSALAGELAASHSALDALTEPELPDDVRAVVSWSYRPLSPDAARLFRLLAVHPGPEVSVPAAASLAALPPAQVRPLLAELRTVSLLDEVSPGRFAMHDLLRAYAGERLAAEDRGAGRSAALHRMLEHYLFTAYRADRILGASHEPIEVGRPRRGVRPERPAGPDEVLAWFDTERRVLLQAVAAGGAAGAWKHVCRLAWSIETYLYRQGRWHELTRVGQSALAAAERLGDVRMRALCHLRLGRAGARLQRGEDAGRHDRAALVLFTEAGDPAGQAQAHVSLAFSALQADDLAEALSHCRRAVELYRGLHRRGLAIALNNLGYVHGRLGEHRLMLEHAREARAIMRAIGDLTGEANLWDSIGVAHHELAEYGPAIAAFEEAVACFRRSGASAEHGGSLVRLGDSRRAAGDADGARRAWRAALEVFNEANQAEAAEARRRLDRLDRPDTMDAIGSLDPTAASG